MDTILTILIPAIIGVIIGVVIGKVYSENHTVDPEVGGIFLVHTDPESNDFIDVVLYQGLRTLDSDLVLMKVLMEE